MGQQWEESQELINVLTQSTEKKISASTPSVTAFYPGTELWTDYASRFTTSIGTHSITEDKISQIFLTNLINGHPQLVESLGRATNRKEDERTCDE